MDLPVDEWKSYLFQKWTLLPKSVQVTISKAKTLSDIFLHSSSLLQEFHIQSLTLRTFHCAMLIVLQPSSTWMCLEDIIRAQTHGYPERLQPKMNLRKAECLVTLGKLQEASQTVSDLESDFAAKQTLAASSFQILQKNLHRLKKKVQEKESLPETFPPTLAKAFEDMDLKEENEQISSVSPSVSLCTDPLKGRCLIATKDILPGELLVKEDAFVSVLNPGEMPHHSLENKWDTKIAIGDLYCHRCLKHTLATVPCDGCSYAKYCSQECMQQAWEFYHSVECPLGALLLTLGVFCHVALRLTLLTRFEDVGKVTSKLRDEISNNISSPKSKNLVKMLNYDQEENDEVVKTPIPGCDISGKYENNYNAVFNLLPHTENHSPEHKFLCALSVSALCKELEAASSRALATGPNSSKLKATVTPELCADLNIWGVAMLRHMLQLQCNAQAITTLQHTGSKESIIANSRQVRLATGIFPVVSLLNHSCSPNTSMSFTSTVATIRAAQRIRKGQEILHCYGPHQNRMGVAERQQKLRSQYFFDCSCPACHTEELRTAAGPRWEAFCCNSCRTIMQGDDVLSCGNRSCTESVSRDHLVSRLQDLQQQVGMAQKLLRSGKLEKAIQQLLRCQQDAESFLSIEHTMVGEIEDDLAQAYAALGDWQKSAAHLQKSLRVVEARHGPSSVEMGHELFKLAQVLFNGFAVPEALNTIQKAEKILLVHCGPWSDEIQELQKMRSFLLDLPPIPAGPLG
ncbi:SET and MYND domain-containing protein 4 isoform X5 [Marmota monax]|uniref:SET and MYND domain-containing protein 4 isoform X5 n=1 Tax=Marmota monax TaxID=9995 RepID=UPI001EAFCD6D|nr:SET and MYND domain-containing protein 4 isoform X5 [Marmota monax]